MKHNPKVYLIGGLGNPGQNFSDNRHNIGFRVIDFMAKSLGVRLTERRFQSIFIRTIVLEEEIILLRPTTFMNRSGNAIKACVDFYHVPVERLLIIHDDVDLPVGRIRVVRGGGAGGHKGVLSIIENVGTPLFPRIKLGIGRPLYEEPIEEYVLSPFYRNERGIIEKVIQMAVLACGLFISDGIEAAMNQMNSQNLAKCKKEVYS